jgi:hypothetical protein
VLVPVPVGLIGTADARRSPGHREERLSIAGEPHRAGEPCRRQCLPSSPMRRDQLKMAKRGVDLGHLKGTDDSLDRSIADKDENALIVAANPLVTEAADPPRLSTATAHPAPEPHGEEPPLIAARSRLVHGHARRRSWTC